MEKKVGKNTMKYEKPEFKKGDTVKTKSGAVGKINRIIIEGGAYWYDLLGGFYHQSEITKA